MRRHRCYAAAFRLGMALGLAFSGTLFLGGCAAFSPDGGMDVVSAITADALDKPARKIDSAEAGAASLARVGRLLSSPLSADAAVTIALLNNKGLQAAYNDLGMAEAEKVEASLPPNPGFSASGISTPVELDIEARLVADILALATLPVRASIADERFRQAQLAATAETLRVGVAARRDYYRAVAARALVKYLLEADGAAQTSAKLADELAATGAMNKLDQAREQSFSVELQTQVVAARQQAASAREALVRTLGLSGSELRFKLPDALPALPRQTATPATVEAEAVASPRRSSDRRASRSMSLAKSYGLTGATRFINLLDAAGVPERSATPSGGAVLAAVPRSSFRCRFSISAKCASVRPARPIWGP